MKSAIIAAIILTAVTNVVWAATPRALGLKMKVNDTVTLMAHHDTSITVVNENGDTITTTKPGIMLLLVCNADNSGKLRLTACASNADNFCEYPSGSMFIARQVRIQGLVHPQIFQIRSQAKSIFNPNYARYIPVNSQSPRKVTFVCE